MKFEFVVLRYYRFIDPANDSHIAFSAHVHFVEQHELSTPVEHRTLWVDIQLISIVLSLSLFLCLSLNRLRALTELPRRILFLLPNR